MAVQDIVLIIAVRIEIFHARVLLSESEYRISRILLVHDESCERRTLPVEDMLTLEKLS
jgi:hypothetical protein